MTTVRMASTQAPPWCQLVGTYHSYRILQTDRLCIPCYRILIRHEISGKRLSSKGNEREREGNISKRSDPQPP